MAPWDAVFGAKRIASDDLWDADDGDAEVVGEVDHAFFFEHDDVARGEGDASAAGGGELLDGGGTDGDVMVDAAVVADCCDDMSDLFTFVFLLGG